MKPFFQYVFVAYLLNAATLGFACVVWPAHPKMGYFFAFLFFAIYQFILGLAALLFRISPRDIFFHYAMTGNSVFVYFFALLFWEGEFEPSLFTACLLAGLILFFTLVVKAIKYARTSREESL
jgi:hypothetical protein